MSEEEMSVTEQIAEMAEKINKLPFAARGPMWAIYLMYMGIGVVPQKLISDFLESLDKK